MCVIINKMITKVNKTVYENPRPIEFIVIHYFGAFGTAKGNALYFRDIKRHGSAHYFVDEEEIWQVVEDKDAAWHCGDYGIGDYKGIAKNYNSIAVEMRPNKLDKTSEYATDKDWFFEEATVKNTIELVRELQQKYGVSDDHIIRHHDVTAKQCPRPFVGNDINEYYKKTGNMMWVDFKRRLKEEEDEEMTQEEFNTKMDAYFDNLKKKAPSEWSEEARMWAEDNELILGDEHGNLQYKSPVTREQMVIFMKRLFELK